MQESTAQDTVSVEIGFLFAHPSCFPRTVLHAALGQHFTRVCFLISDPRRNLNYNVIDRNLYMYGQEYIERLRYSKLNSFKPP